MHFGLVKFGGAIMCLTDPSAVVGIIPESMLLPSTSGKPPPPPSAASVPAPPPPRSYSRPEAAMHIQRKPYICMLINTVLLTCIDDITYAFLQK